MQCYLKDYLTLIIINIIFKFEMIIRETKMILHFKNYFVKEVLFKFYRFKHEFRNTCQLLTFKCYHNFNY